MDFLKVQYVQKETIIQLVNNDISWFIPCVNIYTLSNIGLTLGVTYGNHVPQGYNCLGVLSCSQPTRKPIQLGHCLIMYYLSIHLKRLGLAIFMCHMFIINQQVEWLMSVVTCIYPPHLGNYSQLSNQGQTLAQKVEPKSHCNMVQPQTFILYSLDEGMHTITLLHFRKKP